MNRSPARGSARKQKVLVYLLGSLGDSIVSIPALRAVRRHFDQAEIVVLQNFSNGGRVLASEVLPGDLADTYLSYEVPAGRIRKLRELARLWLKLRRERFDAAAYLIMSERPEADITRDRIFFRSTGIRELFGFHAIPPEDLYPTEETGRPARSEHEAVFKLRRLAADGIAIDLVRDLRSPLINPPAAEVEYIDRWLKGSSIRAGVPLISIAPGCTQQVNEWPEANFAELGRRLLADGSCDIVVTGGKAEFELGERLVAAWNGGTNAAGLFSVQRSAALLSRCSIHIGLDTGTTHLAAAVGTRCFVIFGERNNPGAWYPLGDAHMIVHHPVPCAACRSFTCAVPGHPCMDGIAVDSVWRHLSEFIHGASGDQGVRVIAV
ncbi:MAG: glycosyltransferase family 9 protein [Pyrinomonadaceae bacterium]